MSKAKWSVDLKEVYHGVIRMQLLNEQDHILTFQDWIDLMKANEAFISFYSKILKDNDFKGFFWEVKPVTEHRLADPFEFVLVESDMLPTIKANPSAFSEHFSGNNKVVSFANLGGDAQLIVPTPEGPNENYGHMAAFLRNAPADQIKLFWQTVASQYQKKIGTEVKWLSTAGLGVYWLHARVDSRPKYYRYKPYKLI